MKKDIDYSDILNDVKNYINITDEEANFFVSLLSFRRLKKKQFLLQAYDVCR